MTDNTPHKTDEELALEAELATQAEDNPCMQICAIEPISGHCFGCGRTADEIAVWTEVTPEQRQIMLAKLPPRMPPLVKLREERRAKRRGNKRRRPASQ